ncbi:nucleoside hydrolase [Arthrobacter sp. 2RAF6]|uniref:nucleoside hydrolase n=1 Tax=Arthrobacter sp. 2RAF6 TaxID=3233002 RepID=UPI003F939A01
MGAQHRIILDTDIGSDVDDALALSLILGSPEAELLGVTTVYGDTLLRARLAKRFGKLAGRELAVHQGIGSPRSGREVWWPGHEGSLHDVLESENIQAEGAVEFLVRQVSEHPGEIDVIAIGPLTNIAAALQADPGFERTVRRLWIMGGAFSASEPEHNFRSDDQAASVVFASKLDIVVTGLEVTRKVEMRREQLELIAAAGPLGAALDADIRQWWAYWNEEWNVPHDPITVLTLLRPELFDLSPRGTVTIALGGETAGLSTFIPDAGGNVRRVETIDAEAVATEITSRIVKASTLELHQID